MSRLFGIRWNIDNLHSSSERTSASISHDSPISGATTDAQPVFEAIAANATRLSGALFGSVQRFDGELIHEAALHNYPAAALEFSRNHQERGREAWILRQIGKIHARNRPPDVERSEFHYRQALKQAEELNMRPLVAHCHLSLGELYAQMGQSNTARKELSTAIDLYRKMEMRVGLREAEIALAKIARTAPNEIVTH